MSNWKKLVDELGRSYYFNSSLNETSWSNPDDLSTCWQTYTTEDGKQYYYNESTKITTWDRPAELDDHSEPVQGEQSHVAAPSSDQTAVSDDLDSDLKQSLLGQSASGNELLQIATKVTSCEADEMFTKLLVDNKVDSTWSFEDVMKKFITSPSYWAIADSLHRKQVYDEYLVSQFKESALDKQSAVDIFKANFINVLRNYHSEGILTHSSRWCSVKRVLISRDDPIFKHAVLLDKQVYKVFKEYKLELESEHSFQVEKQKEQAIEELKFYLADFRTQLALEAVSWMEFHDKLLKNSRFQENRHFDILSKSDILAVYEAQVYPKAIKDLESEISQVEKTNYRLDRKARETFRTAIASLKITPLLSLDPILSQLEDTDEFIDLCGRNGLAPVQIVLDTIEEMRQQLTEKASALWHVLNNAASDDFTLENVLSSKESLIEAISHINCETISPTDPDIGVLYLEMKKRLLSKLTQQAKTALQQLELAKTMFAQWLINSKNGLLSTVSSEDLSQPCRLNFIKPDNQSGVYVAVPLPSSDLAALNQKLMAIPEYAPVLDSITAVKKASGEVDQGLVEYDTIREIAAKVAFLFNSNEPTRQKRGAEELTEDGAAKRHKSQLPSRVASSKAKPVLNY